jgi:hypothetical protein
VYRIEVTAGSTWSKVSLKEKRRASVPVAFSMPDCTGQERCPDEPLRFEIEITVAP